MKTEKQIRGLIVLMTKTYESGSDLSCVESPADAFNSSETLKWVLNEPSLINELFEHAGMKQV